MATKTAAIRSRAVTAHTPAKSGSAKAVQRKKLPNLFVLPSPVQRKEKPGSWMHQQSLKPVNGRSLIQPKVKVHESNDHFEKEADHIADKVVSQEKISSPVKVSSVSTGAQRKCASCEKEEAPVQAKHVQRKCSSCEEKESVQAKHNNNSDRHSGTLHSSDSSPPASQQHTTSHSLDSVLSSQSTRGSPLPEQTRALMEGRMGADFSNVRIHTSQQSHEASTSINARAFTQGGNIHFANGEFNPHTTSGKHLLAHELAHTMQQGASPAQAKTRGHPVNALRKVVPKPQHEKKIARIPSAHDKKESSVKHADDDFAKKFKNKKAPKLPSSTLKKGKGKKLNKEPPVLPKKEEKKKQDKPAKPAPKANHFLNAKAQQSQISQLVTGGINFKPHPDKETENDPLQKAQSLQSKKISENVLSKASQSSALITSVLAQVRPRLSLSSANAVARVKANELLQKEKIKTSIKAEKDAAKKAMQQAAGSISGYHAKVTSEIKAAATKAKADISLAKTINSLAMEAAALAQLPKIDKTYEEAKKDFEASGRSVGNECYSSQNQRSWNEFLSKMKHEDDSWYDGPYTDDKKEARSNAALKVGEGYRDGMIKAGNEQAGKIDQGKPNDHKKVVDAKAEMLKHLNELYDNSLKGIEAAEKSGISQADSTKKSMLNSVYGQHKAAQTKLDTTEKTQLQVAEILSIKQSQQIELQAAQAIESMEEGGAQSLMHLNNGFKEYKLICESMNSPPPAMLQLKLQPIEANLAQSAPAMAASLQRGMMQTEAGFNKTAAETITTTNTTVTESLTEAKATNDNAIAGLKKLQSAAITSLQGILNNNKKTITATASQCVTGIQTIKTALDDSLTKIGTDLAAGLKSASQEFKKALQDAVNKGTEPDYKSMLATSIKEEDAAEAKVEPRWKSVLKVLLVIVVTLLIALVVGPAVIGFIGALAGGGAFGAAVGAVVGGAILGALSSGVITVGNNLIDGKSWHEGLGHAMLEGAITGAIGGAFGAAGSGIAGKIIGQAAKGVGPALGRFAIQQTIDFAGNIATEFVSSKLQGKPFSWTAVAQGQAIGAGMHIGMGGLGSLKNVKGFKTINAITEGAEKLGSKLGNKVAGKPPVPEPHISTPKTTTEEPHSKGPPAPKEEPHPTAKPGEETKASAPKEEPVTAAPKEEPHPTTKPAEEPSGKGPGAPKEEPHGSAKPSEEPSSGKAPVEEKKPSNLTAEEKDMGIAAKHPTEDGHHMKVTENGTLVKCSTCEMVDFHKNPNKKDLPESKQKEFGEEWNNIQKETDPEIKAKKAAEFDKKLDIELKKNLSEGAYTAKQKGYPPAPDGYQWNKGPNGEPFISRKKNTSSTVEQLVFDKENNTFVKPDELPKPVREVEVLPKKTQAELEEIAKGLDPSAKKDLKSNTLEHKAARWEEYKARNNEKPMSFEAWSNTYDSNMNNAIRGNKVANEVHNDLGWGKREVTVEIDGQKRRLDIADPSKNKGVEVKAYESGKVGSDPHILKEIELDGKLIAQKDWDIEWVFKGCEPTDSIKQALQAAGIKIKTIP